jgi:hypothetical protein
MNNLVKNAWLWFAVVAVAVFIGSYWLLAFIVRGV